jgi:hypothetical protein
MKLPGILYSFILAVATWATTYFATGNPGGDYVWAPILLLVIPAALKALEVYAPSDEPMARSLGVSDSKTRRLFLG